MTATRPASPLLVAALAAAALAASSGCNTGLHLDPNASDAPGVSLRPAPQACDGNGNAVDLAFDPTQTRVILDRSAADPINVADVVGTASNLPPTDQIFVIETGDQADCPLFQVVAATLTGSTFTAELDLADHTAVRVFAIATTAALADITCTASGCFQAGTASPDGVSQALLILR